MTDPYLFERGIGQQMGDLCRLAVGEAKVTQTGEIVTLEDMLGRDAFGVSVEVPYTSGGVTAVEVRRCGKNLFDPLLDNWEPYLYENSYYQYRFKYPTNLQVTMAVNSYTITSAISILSAVHPVNFNNEVGIILINSNWSNKKTVNLSSNGYLYVGSVGTANQLRSIMAQNKIQVELGSTATTYEPYNGDTYTITLPADFFGGSINLTTGTVTSRYAADGTELAEPVVTKIDPISIPILAGVNNVWADVGTVTVSYYAADAETFRPALWYPTLYRGLTSARYLIKRASGAIASFDDAVAAPLVGLRVALPWRSEGYQAVEVTRCGKNLLDIDAFKDYSNWQSSGAPSGDMPITYDNKFFRFFNGKKFQTEKQFTVTWSPISAESYPTYMYLGYIKDEIGTCRAYLTTETIANLIVSFLTTQDAVDGIRLGSTRNIEIFGIQIAKIETIQLELGTPTTYEPYNGDTYTITLPTTIYGGYLDVVTGQLVATHDETGNLLTNQKLYFLDPVNVSALAGVNNVWSDAGDVAVSYRVEQ